VLQWIAGDEGEDLASRHLVELKEREDRAKRHYLEEQAPLKAALRQAQLESPDELLALFDERAQLDLKREQAAARALALRQDPRVAAGESERQELEAERQSFDAAVSAQGFARPIQQIEDELKEALGLRSSEKHRKAPLPDAEVPKQLYARAAEVLGTPVEPLASAVEPRLAAYLAALTDKRVVAGRMNETGQLMLSTPDGRWGPYAGLPLPLRDLAYVALRLALLERVTLQRKLPVLIDDAFAPLEGRSRQLLARMVKGIAAQAQVVHRAQEPLPQGVADHVVQLP
jgi:hypothetical protein